ncbi:MAG TPA: phosphopantothenoylcysteine decarboxylase [Planctomycetota bacterium]|nr:phosphopantothenoylcysteine decarboxylase [Planctomycetota bacterium]
MSAPRARAAKRATRLSAVVTAGPTREYVDPVRYLSNESSGRMGFAIASALARRGARVTLIAGPVSLATPSGVERIDVTSARDMHAAVAKAFRNADALVMSAAVADWRPARKLAGKWRKKDGGAKTARLDLTRNPDILASVARGKGERLVVGFALETGDGERRAQAKLRRKNLDYIVLNDESALNAIRSSATILGRDGSRQGLARRSKEDIAEVLAELVIDKARLH